MRFRRKSARVSRRGFFRAKRAGHRKSSGGGWKGDLGLIGGAMAYGAGREWISGKLDPITSKVVPFAGQYADEAVMGTLGYLAMKGKIPFVNKYPITRDIGRAIVVVEAARVGAGLANGFGTTTAPTQNVGNSILY